MHEFTQSSDLPVTVEEILRTLTMSGVNAELRPLVRMTAPAPWATRPIFDWPEQKLLFTSWILLLGVLPIDRHAFSLRSVIPGKGFIEASSSTINRHWTHQRSIVPAPGGCRVTDIVAYQSRLPLLGSLLKPVYRLVFRLRHRNLRSRYGRHTN